MKMCMLAYQFSFLLLPLLSSDGFLILTRRASSTSSSGAMIAINCQSSSLRLLRPVAPEPKRKSTLLFSSVSSDDDDSNESSYRPRPPSRHAIDTTSLLSQAYDLLTVVQLRDILRQHGAKVSGNKRELIDRLQCLFLSSQKNRNTSGGIGTVNNNQNNNQNNNGKTRTFIEGYNRYTIKELKDLLRQHKEKVSGNKAELVHRLMILRLQSENESAAKNHDVWDNEG
mmetsp:Transcript_41198/g.86499  ORF Transcript_41198/g.86499 Transcript_41198/m.86499 type:complete len:227 (-) Transcript_41198:901-1581(-)